MAVSLVKGGNVSLTKEAPGLTSVTVGLGWDVRKTDGQDFDLDASAFVVGADESSQILAGLLPIATTGTAKIQPVGDYVAVMNLREQLNS